uniref:Uncharacterized protein n=1 Tax=Panagrolaimus sp. ES5 TaxID=591445 RepID=A0AC34GA87_9BILA
MLTSLFSILVLTTVIIGVDGFGYNDCAAYNLLEAQVNCGPDGYLMNYGIVYCHRFFTPAYYNQFDAAGKAFVDCTGQCLVNKATAIVNQQVSSNDIDCTEISDKAIDSHSDCYLQCGFCNVCKKNKKAFFNVLQADAFANPKLLNEAFQTVGKCGFKCLI